MTLAVNKTQDQNMYPTTVGGRSMGLFKQRYSETITYLIDYSQWLDDGDTIASSSFLISPQTTPAVDITGTTIQDGNTLLFQIDNGKENTRYIVTVEITTSTGQIKSDYFQLNVGTPAGDAMQSGIDTALSAAQTAQLGAETAQTGAETARTGAQTARTGAEIARTGAETAAAAAAAAKGVAETASYFAQTKAGEAQLAESNALLYKNITVDKAGETLINATAAGQSASTASTKAAEAAASAASASTSASTATTKAADASTYSSSAATSAATATTKASQSAASEGNAATSAATATTKASEASASAAGAASSATTATTKASESASSATNAASSASSANSSKIAAQSAQTAAVAAQVAAESARDATLAAYDSFDDRYLGAKSSDPTLDNDGNALVGGTLYFNTVSQSMKLYTGSAWVNAYVSGDIALLKTNNLSDLTNVATARTNLGLTALATTAPGTGVATALAIAIGAAGAFVTNGGALGTPASGDLTNCTFPTLNQNTTGTASNVTGTVAVANGGTGLTTLTAGYIPYGNGTGAFSSSANLQFDGSNLGLGVTPSAWSGVTALQLVGSGALASSNQYFEIDSNTYYNSGYKYIGSGAAAKYTQEAGKHVWYNAASGTANNAISFTQAMTLDASSNLLVGMTSAATSSAKTIHLANATAPTANPSGGGVLYVESGALKYRGSSGTVTTIAAA
jgi:hypothetical protein